MELNCLQPKTHHHILWFPVNEEEEPGKRKKRRREENNSEAGIGESEKMRGLTVFSQPCLREPGESTSEDKHQELWTQKMASPTTQTQGTRIPCAESSKSSNTNSPCLLFLMGGGRQNLSTKIILVYVNRVDIMQLYCKLFLKPQLKVSVPCWTTE